MRKLLLVYIITQICFLKASPQVTPVSSAQGKTALVIGNADYNFSPLATPVKDAEAMSETLRKLGFEVFLYRNLDHKGFIKSVEDFTKDLYKARTGLVYFGGHAIQSKGYNYLIPVDAVLKEERSVRAECIPVDWLLEKMASSGASVKIMIMDAGFTNPFEGNLPDSLRGFVSINAPLGTIVSSAASPGHPAMDNKSGTHGLLTEAILQTIETPDISIEMMFQKVRKKVAQESGNLQIPWESTSLTEDFCFNPVAIAGIDDGRQVNAPSATSKYNIEIKSPPSDNYITSNDRYNLQACIKASEKVERLMIYRNGSFVNGYLSKNLSSRGDCDIYVNELLPLKLGINNIRIEAFTGDDTLSKSITIEYSLAAAKYYAILIGNDLYDDPRINDLDNPVKDASVLSQLLTSKYYFDPANVILLKNPAKAEIIGALHKLRSVITPADNLLIFYAGHGLWDEGMGMGFWLPRDASKDNPVNWIPNTDLTNFLGAIKSKHTLLVADACFSGGIFKTRAITDSGGAVEMLYQMNSRNAITSGTLTEVPDRSVFTEYLLKNLLENTSQYLPAQELFSKIKMAVINNSRTVPQFGTIQNAGDEGGDFIFIMR